MPDTSVYDLGNRWFSERASVYRKFTVVHATIAMHFNIPPGAKKAKTLSIELRLGAGTRERSYYPALAGLLNDIGQDVSDVLTALGKTARSSRKADRRILLSMLRHQTCNRQTFSDYVCT